MKNLALGAPRHVAIVSCLLALLQAAAPATAEIFVTNDGAQTVTVYANSATGNQAPLRQFDVSGQPRGIFVDTANNEIFVALQNGDIEVFNIAANGAAVPLRTIETSGDLQGIHVDVANNEVFVADRFNQRILVYTRAASGAATPLRTLDIGEEPRGVFVDAGLNELYVSRRDQVLTFARTAADMTAPLRVIAPLPGLGDMSQLVLAGGTELIVANHEEDAIRVWPRTANGNVSPIRSIVGAATLLDSPRGVAICSGSGEYLATARNDDMISFYPPGANGNVPPVRVIAGDATGLDSPRFLAVTGRCGGLQAAPALGLPALLVLACFLGMAGMVCVRRARRTA